METFKQTLKIIGIVLASLLGVVIILCVLTAVIPSFYVFGYKFVTGSVGEEQKVIEYNSETDYALNIHTGSYSVDIIADPELEGLIGYSYKGAYFGFANMSSARLIVTEDINALNLSMREPSGLLAKTSSKISIYVNPNVVYDLTFRSDAGSLYVYDVALDKVNIIGGIGDVSIEAKVEEEKTGKKDNDEQETPKVEKVQNLSCLNITANDGTYDFSTYDKINVLGTSNISIGNGELKFKDLNASLNIRGKECSLSATNISSPNGIKMVCSSGNISAQMIDAGTSEFVLIADNLNVNAQNVKAQVGITATGGNVYIKEIEGEAIIKTTSADIKVEKAHNNIFATATSGNIVVEKYYMTGQFVTTSGNITVNSLSELNTEYYSTLASSSGTITFENNFNKSSVSITGKGVAKIKYWNVAQSGNVEHEVYIPNGEASIGIMAFATDIFRMRLVGDVVGSINNLLLYANDNFIYHPVNSTSFLNQTTFVCTGQVLTFSKLDLQQ